MACPPCGLMWLGLALPRVGAFCWLVVTGKMSNMDNLRRRGFVLENISDLCSLYGKERKTISNSFSHW